MSTFHTTVFLQEAVDYLNITPGNWYVDATLGGGGHSREIINRGGKVIGIDQDPEAIEETEKILRNKDVLFVQANFTKLAAVLEQLNMRPVSGVLFDLGVSSHQLEKAERGFSFQHDGPLDMRADPTLEISATDLVNNLSQQELYGIFKEFGEDPNSWRIADAIVRERGIELITTTGHLARVIESVVPRTGKIHPATRVFQALRIAVNTELENLQQGLEQAFEILRENGRIVTISFHSGEDRVIKIFFKQKELEKKAISITKKPMIPTDEEIMQNPRARSAKMRVLEKTKT